MEGEHRRSGVAVVRGQRAAVRAARCAGRRRFVDQPRAGGPLRHRTPVHPRPLQRGRSRCRAPSRASPGAHDRTSSQGAALWRLRTGRWLPPGFAGGSLLVGRRKVTSRRSGVSSFQRLTFRRGLIRSARFAPDGQTIFYGALWDGELCRVHSTRTDNPESRALDLPNANVLAVSRTGDLRDFPWAEPGWRRSPTARWRACRLPAVRHASCSSA